MTSTPKSALSKQTFQAAKLISLVAAMAILLSSVFTANNMAQTAEPTTASAIRGLVKTDKSNELPNHSIIAELEMGAESDPSLLHSEPNLYITARGLAH